MRCVVQRVTEASVTVNGETVGAVGPGLMVLIGVSTEDTDADLKYMAEKVPNLRIFDDENGVMNLSVMDVGQMYVTCRLRLKTVLSLKSLRAVPLTSSTSVILIIRRERSSPNRNCASG